MFKDKADPVGLALEIPEIEQKITKYTDLWKSFNHKSFWRYSANWSRIINFLILALDDFISTLVNSTIPGPDKKATVLLAIDKLYDFTVKEALPFWLRPFATPIKLFIIYVFISNCIDWIVAKYQTSTWRPIEKTALDRILIKAGVNCVTCKIDCAKGGAK